VDTATTPQRTPNSALDLDHYRETQRSEALRGGSPAPQEEDEMWFHGIDVEHAWRIVFWVILTLAVVASAAHAIFA
jgi:hypothetical protein